MKLLRILFLVLLSSNICLSQTYVSGTISERSAGFNLLGKEKNHHLGFGATFFRNKGNIGEDRTNFVRVPNPDVYETLKAVYGTIYGMYGRKYKNNIVSISIGMATRKWVYNATASNGTNYHAVKDGGTYLLYGINYMKEWNTLVVGTSVDNFNGISLSLGVKFKN